MTQRSPAIKFTVYCSVQEDQLIAVRRDALLSLLVMGTLRNQLYFSAMYLDVIFQKQ